MIRQSAVWLLMLLLLPRCAAAAEIPEAVARLMRRAVAFYAETPFRVRVTHTTRIQAGGRTREIRARIRLTLVRPNRFALELESSGSEVQAMCDGTSLTTYLPARRQYTVEQAPTDVDTLLAGDGAFSAAASTMPIFSTLLSAQGYERVMAGVVRAEYLGVKEGRHHLRFAEEGLDWELWLRDGEVPLVERVRLDASRDALARLPPEVRETAGEVAVISEILYSDWEAGPVPPGVFRFHPPEGAREVTSFDRPRAPLPGPPLKAAWKVEGPWEGVAPGASGRCAYALSAGGDLLEVDSAGVEAARLRTEEGHSVVRRARFGFLAFRLWGTEVVALDGEGRRLWSYPGATGMDDAAAADLDGDGADEVVLGFNGLLGLHVLDQEGRLLWKDPSIGNVWTVAAGDLDGDGRLEVLSTSARGYIHLFDASGKRRANLVLPFYAIAVRLARVLQPPAILAAGSGPEGPVAARISTRQELVWVMPLPGPSPPVDLQASPSHPLAAVGLQGGDVLVLDLETGEALAHVSTGARRPQLAWLVAPDGSPLLVIATGSALEGYRLPGRRERRRGRRAGPDAAEPRRSPAAGRPARPGRAGP